MVKSWINKVTGESRTTFNLTVTVQVWLKNDVRHFWDPQTWPLGNPDLIKPCL